ncbi:unnamed protein product, partial [Polarella glacialis]
MEAPGAGDGLAWFYLDSTRKEFGPFPNEMMREWYMQGFFPIGEGLLVRLPSWKQHVPLRMVYPDVSEAFIGQPRTSSPAPQPPPQVDLYSGFSDNQLPYQVDDHLNLMGGMGGSMGGSIGGSMAGGLG